MRASPPTSALLDISAADPFLLSLLFVRSPPPHTNSFCTTKKSDKPKLCGDSSTKMDLCGMSPDAQQEGPDYRLQAAEASKPKGGKKNKQSR